MAKRIPPGKLKRLNAYASERSNTLQSGQVTQEANNSVVAKEDIGNGVDLFKVLFFRVSTFLNAVAMFFR